MTEAEEETQTTPRTRLSRLKRLAPWEMGMPKRQMVEVQRFYKGEEIVMPVMQVTPPENENDTFVASAKKMEASIRLGK